jgi:hypothetical protein
VLSKGFPRRDLWEDLVDATRSGKPLTGRLARFNRADVAMPRKTRWLPVFRLFDLATELVKVLPDQSDRELLSRRLRSFLTSRRRGNLKLPARFPRELDALTKMTKSQLRARMFRVTPRTSLYHHVSRDVVRWSAQVIPGGIWSRCSKVDHHMANVVGAARLGKTQWPRITRNEWPSTPTVSELLEMSRRGVKHHGMRKPSYTVPNCATRKLLSDDIRAATKVVSKNILGIRSSEEVPRSYLKYFRYRDGFLILTVRWCMPAGLVRFLLARWQIAPTSLWLVENCRLKYYLRTLAADWLRTDRRRSRESSVSLEYPSSLEEGKLPFTGELVPVSEDEFAAEWGDSLKEWYRQLT